MDKNVQYILEVAKCGGITKAANNLYITPSALSKFVQAREEELNVQLFHRIGKRFVLTAAGELRIIKFLSILTEIMRITVKKQIVSAGNCIGFDPVAGQNGVLHAIIAYK